MAWISFPTCLMNAFQVGETTGLGAILAVISAVVFGVAIKFGRPTTREEGKSLIDVELGSSALALAATSGKKAPRRDMTLGATAEEARKAAKEKKRSGPHTYEEYYDISMHFAFLSSIVS